MRSGSENRAGFTLLELLTAGAVFIVILLLILTMTSHFSRVTTRGTSAIAAFQEARTAFETMQRMLSQAVLNSYWDYDSPTSPTHYLRASELHFVLGASADLIGPDAAGGSAIFCQAPLDRATDVKLRAQGDLLNAFGFYVRFSESPDVPNFLDDQRAGTRAWRLWMALEPAEDLSVYSRYSGKPQDPSNLDWLQTTLAAKNNHVLANHVILLLVRAGYSNASGAWMESYAYDSRGGTATTSFPQAPEIHQLPPVLHLTMVALDARSATQLLGQSEGQPYDLIPRSNLFKNAAKYQDDLKELTDHLNDKPLGIPITYRIFETTVNVTASKWSR